MVRWLHPRNCRPRLGTTHMYLMCFLQIYNFLFEHEIQLIKLHKKLNFMRPILALLTVLSTGRAGQH